MDINIIRVKLFDSLDELGVIVDNTINDFDLQEYITDSIMFITFIINIERQLSIEIPDELLLISKMNSFAAYCETMLSVVTGTYKVD